MAVEIKVPVLAESVADATLLSWRKNVGDYVRRDENLVDLETDKVVLEITAPKDGVLIKIRKQDGATVTSEEIIAEIDPDAKVANTPATPAPAKASAAPIPEPQAQATPAVAQAVGLSPAVRRLVDEHSLDPTRIEASGKSGRLTKADVLDYLDAKATPAPAAPEQAGTAPIGLSGARPERRVPFSRLRARVAERLKEAQNTAAILTTFNEVDMKPVMDLRNRYKEVFVKQHGVKLGFMSFFVKAVVEALKSFPVINASVDGNDIVYHGYYDIGIAVSTPRGLVVPILRDADLLSFAGIEQTMGDYGARAQDGKLGMDELTGGTFSISNGGVFGSLLSTPILNPPQSAILGMHNIVERPVVENGEIVIRPMMYLALSYDHRIIDGSDAVLFLVAVKKALEDPARMLLSI